MMAGKGVIKQVTLVVLTITETDNLRLSIWISRVRLHESIVYVV